MTPQERQLLEDFLRQLTGVRGTVKNPEAEALIANAVATQPDAVYLLVQRVILMEQALTSAKAQIAQLQDQLPANAGGGNFLGGNGWGRSSPAVAPNAVPSSPSYPANAVPPAAQPGFLSGGTGSFLGNIAATAAGVAGGAFLFQGIEHLLGHHGGGFLGQGLTGGVIENTTINNYHGDDSALWASGKAGSSDSLLDSGFDDSITDDGSWI